MINYYTDEHNVDEDLRTIAKQGARYEDPDYAGIFKRNLNRDEFYSASSVASSNMKNSHIIRITTMSTKMSGLSVVVAGSGYSQSGQVLHLDIWTIVHPLYLILLLRRAYKNIELYG